MHGRPDIVATLKLRPTQKGGRKGETPSQIFRCPLEFDGDKCDSVIDLSNSGPLKPYYQVSVPISFVNPTTIKPRLKIGSQFTLWELTTIADGVVDHIYYD
jgi:hypothetical protein